MNMSIFESHSDLILSLAKFTSALLIAFAVAPFLKRPALRAIVWAGMLIILPTMTFATHGRSILKILPQFAATAEIENVQQIPPPLEAVMIPAIATDLPEIPRIAPQAPVRKTNWLTVVFFTGLAVCLLPILISVLRIRFIQKTPAGDAAMDVWAKIRPQESAEVPLYFTRSPYAPFTIGLIREAVFLPEFSTEWSLRRLRSTLYHEAAHISRKDPLVRVFACLVRAIFWFHPLVWLAHRQLVAAQEEACDEIVLAAGIPADEYAEDLLETAKYSQAALGHCLNMARWSQLGSRVRLILQNKNTEPNPLTMKTIAIVSLGIAASTFGLSSLGFSEAPQAVENAPEQSQKPAESEIESKLRRIIIPRIDLEDCSLEEAIDFLRLRAKELDITENDPAKKGVNFVIRSSRPAVEKGDGADPASAIIAELRLRNVPLAEVLRYICEAARRSYKVDEFAVTIGPVGELKGGAATIATGPGAAIITKKLNQIIIPRVEFEDTTLEEAIDFLRLLNMELDKEENDPTRKGFNFVIRRPRPANEEVDGAVAEGTDPASPRIKKLSLHDVPIGVVLKYVCDATNMTYKVDEFAVTLVPQDKAD